ncbi:unnamed protein product [Fraxinus pennsylvanica]|uniref:EF-hand domain-containing protein n=1 Tax=Fraxinus pennsylvanica TaxID=56036 RepID=A0AAD2DWU3_9LAMI|nr:unnamed protein product [Fraxinus pennsylvanica]
MIAEVDKDGSGAIDFDEFCHMMTAKFGERDAREELMKAFYIIDEDKIGKISAADIQRIAKELGERFSDREIQEMINEQIKIMNLIVYDGNRLRNWLEAAIVQFSCTWRVNKIDLELVQGWHDSRTTKAGLVTFFMAKITGDWKGNGDIYDCGLSELKRFCKLWVCVAMIGDDNFCSSNSNGNGSPPSQLFHLVH